MSIELLYSSGNEVTFRLFKQNVIIRNYGDRAFGVVFRSVKKNSAVAASLSSSRRGTMVFKRTGHI